jgi:hypothetical protein
MHSASPYLELWLRIALAAWLRKLIPSYQVIFIFFTSNRFLFSSLYEELFVAGFIYSNSYHFGPLCIF